MAKKKAPADTCFLQAWLQEVLPRHLDATLGIDLEQRLAAELVGQSVGPGTLGAAREIIGDMLDRVTLGELARAAGAAPAARSGPKKKRAPRKPQPAAPSSGNGVPPGPAQTEVEDYVKNAPPGPLAKAGHDDDVHTFLTAQPGPLKIGVIAETLNLEIKDVRGCLRRLRKADRAKSSGAKKGTVWEATAPA